MIKFCTCIILLITTLGYAQYPNDCLNYVQVCGNYSINLDVAGAGVQEISANVCQSYEHNSLWLHFTVEQGGTLGFDLIPESTSIQEDYDFWVFGPNVSCGNLGQAIRCSTTNPQAANQGNNYTGLNQISTDVSEGPGELGDSYLKWLDVQAGEEYFLVIDRPIGYSAFQLNWTGTALLDNPLENYTISQADPLFLCDEQNDGVESFDLSTIANQWVNDLNGIEITYHLSENDAFVDLNPLPTIADLQTRTYYVRVENIGSKCFEVYPFQVEVSGLGLPEPYIRLCDEGNDGQEFYDLSQITFGNYSISFHNSLADSQTNQNPITDLNYTVNGNTTLYLRVENSDGCPDFTTVNFEIIEKPDVDNRSQEVCFLDTLNGVNLINYDSLFQEQSQFTVSYYSSQQNRENNTPINGSYSVNLGGNIIYVRVFNAECYQDRTFILTVNENPDLGEDEVIKICPEELPYTLPSTISGYSSYEWSTGELGTTSITVDDVGEYQVTATNIHGCTYTKTYKVEFYQIPIITELIVENESQITVNVLSESTNLLYSLDNGTWQQSNVFSNLSPGVHQVNVKLETGCFSESKNTYLLDLTNFISPNGDGINDTWSFPGLNEVEGSTIKIVDRYGKIIYQEDGQKPFVWNGSFNGQTLPTADYWYIISMPDGRKHIGHITIKNSNE